jgi:rRNA-processing protein FCF1
MTLETLLSRSRTAGVLVDTNLLLLYVIGATDPALISRFKRTSTFTATDYHLLLAFLARFRQVMTTAHILAETSNLAGQITDASRLAVFTRFAASIGVLTELASEAREAADDPMFPRFGLTDVALLQQAEKGRYMVLTDDFRLAQYLGHKDVPVLNFNHLRVYMTRG